MRRSGKWKTATARWSKMGVRVVEAFNERVKKAKDKGEVLKRTVQTGFDCEAGKPVHEDDGDLEFEAMPYIVVVVDEVADLMMISGKEIEGAVQRLAQMARRRHPSYCRCPLRALAWT